MPNEPKTKLALYWAAGCGGCDIAVLELHERILELVKSKFMMTQILAWSGSNVVPSAVRELDPSSRR